MVDADLDLATVSNSFPTDSGTAAPTANALTLSGGSGIVTSGATTIVTIAISPTYVGQTSITTLGTISTGTWEGTVIDPTYGGTGTSTTFTQGSVVFAGASGVYSEDNSNFVWNDASDYLTLGTVGSFGPAEGDRKLNISGGSDAIDSGPRRS